MRQNETVYRMSPTRTGKEVTTQNALSYGGALRAHSRSPDPAALGAELASCTSHTRRGLFNGCESRREASRDRLRGTSSPKGETSGSERVNLRRYGKPHTPLWQGWEQAEHFGGGQRHGLGELREPQ